MSMFELGFSIVLPVGLVLVMFGMGLSLTTEDFRRVVEFPRAAIIGTAGQLLLLPAIAFAITLLIPLDTNVALGLIVIAACPGGVASNAIVFAAKADVALSVTLTALNSLITVFTIPIIVSLGLYMQLGSSGDVPDLPVLSTMGRLMLITILPIGSGMLVRLWSPKFANAVHEPFRIGSIVVLIIVVIGVVGLQLDSFFSGLIFAGPAVLLLNLLAMALGFTLAQSGNLSHSQRTTVAIEIGLQNGTLGVLVALTLLQMKEVAIVPGIYAAIMLLTGGAFAAIVRSRHRK